MIVSHLSLDTTTSIRLGESYTTNDGIEGSKLPKAPQGGASNQRGY